MSRAKYLAHCAAVCLALLAASCSDKGAKPPETRGGPAGKLYVLNQADNSIFVYDTESMTKIKTIDTQIAKPHYIAFAPDGATYYVMTVDLSGSIAKFDATTDQLIQTFNITTAAQAQYPGQRSITPAGMAITPDSKYGYICDYYAGSERGHIFKVNLETMAVEKRVQSGAQTHELLATADGGIVIACNLRSDDITMLYTDEDTVTFIPIDPDVPSDPDNIRYGPYCIALDRTGEKAYITCLNAHQVRILDIAERRIVDSLSIPITPGTSISGPAMVHTTHDGKYLFLSTKWGNSIVVVDLQTIQVVGEIPTGISHTFGVAITKDDKRVYVAASGIPPAHGYVYEIDVATKSKVDSVEVGTDSWGLGWVGEDGHSH